MDQLRSAATISDLEWVVAIDKLRTYNPETGYYSWVMVWDLAKELDIHPNRIHSKMRRANKRKLSEGCNCGCRGDITLMPIGEELLELTKEDSMATKFNWLVIEHYPNGEMWKHYFTKKRLAVKQMDDLQEAHKGRTYDLVELTSPLKKDQDV